MNVKTMRSNADVCFTLAAKYKNDEATRLRYMRMATAWQDLADNQDWLDGAVAGPSVVPAMPHAA